MNNQNISSCEMIFNTLILRITVLEKLLIEKGILKENNIVGFYINLNKDFCKEMYKFNHQQN